MAADDMHMMMVDGKLTTVDMGPMLRRHRSAVVGARADVVDGVVDLLGVESLDIADVLDASGVDEPGRDAACYLALSLKLVELGGDVDGR